MARIQCCGPTIHIVDIRSLRCRLKTFEHEASIQKETLKKKNMQHYSIGALMEFTSIFANESNNNIYQSLDNERIRPTQQAKASVSTR